MPELVLYKGVMYTFHIFVPEISTIIPEVCQAIVQALKGHMKVSEKIKFYTFMLTVYCKTYI